MVSPYNCVELVQIVSGQLSKVLNDVIFDYAISGGCDEADGLRGLLNRSACQLLLLAPKTRCHCCEVIYVARVIQKLVVLRLVSLIHLSILALENMVWLDVGQWDQVLIDLIQPLCKEPIERC